MRYRKYASATWPLAIALWLLAPASAQAALVRSVPDGPRLALVIGNGMYRHAARLTNPTNDARLVATTLRSLGFHLVGDAALIDADRAVMEHAIHVFVAQLHANGTGVFYYAGHGVGIGADNYLVPVGATVGELRDVDIQLISVGSLLKEMARASTRSNIVILDACRNNPFHAVGMPRGIREMPAENGFLMYSAQAGQAAADGTGKHSPFTEALTKEMLKPGLDVFEAFKNVVGAVSLATAGQQKPYMASALVQPFQFRPVDGAR